MSSITASKSTSQPFFLAPSGPTTGGTPRGNPHLRLIGGSVSEGIQASLTPFAHWQRVGVLGFHLALRGFDSPSVRVRQCKSAILRLWQAGRIVESAPSTDRLVCAGPTSPANAASEVVRTDVTTQQFGMMVDRAGIYEIDLVEILDGGSPVTVTSNRVWVMVTNN